jgi:hypothetical protein
VNETLTMYEFESIVDLLNSMPSKDRWKNYVRNKIETYWRQKILKMAEGKSTLCFLHPMSMKVGSVHNVWASTGLDCTSIMKANIKARLLSGVYILQSNRSRFNKYEVSATCPMCMVDIEDTEHFLLHCSRTQDVRELFITNLRAILSDINREVENIVFSDKAMLLKVILDVSSPQIPVVLQTDLVMKKIEAISRGLIYALHHRRCDILNIAVGKDGNVN